MVKYKVNLNTEEQETLRTITSVGKHSARKIKRANILLMSYPTIYRGRDCSTIISEHVNGLSHQALFCRIWLGRGSS